MSHQIASTIQSTPDKQNNTQLNSCSTQSANSKPSMTKEFWRKYLYLALLFLGLLCIIVIIIDGAVYGYSWFSANQPEPIKLEDDIRYNGYFSENHNVKTKDGNFTLIRMRKSEDQNITRHPILLAHGILGSPADWLVGGPNRSLGYLLADADYDVWVFDCSKCSNKSWHDIGVQYYPKIVDYIIDKTGSYNVSFVGHSSANSAFFAMASEDPEISTRIGNQVSVSPIAYLGHSTNEVLQKISKLEQNLQHLEEYLHANLKSAVKSIKNRAQKRCNDDKTFDPEMCRNPGFLIHDYHAYQLDPRKLKYVEPYTPDDIDVKGLQHYAQIAKSGDFVKFNYGRKGNLERYGTPQPPRYDLTALESPVHVLYSRNDSLTNEEDVNALCRNIRNCNVYHIGDKYVGLDQKYGRDAPEQINKKIVDIFNDQRMEYRMQN